MSSRHLRKLDASSAVDLVKGDGDFEPETLQGARPKQKNVFDLLMTRSSDENEDSDRDDDSTTLAADASSVSATSDIKRKSKRRRKKKKSVNLAPKSSENDYNEDEVERSVREVNALLGPSIRVTSPSNASKSRHFGHSQMSQIRRLFSVDFKFLNAENEMKRLFGHRVVLAEQQQRQQQHHHRRGGGHHRARVVKGIHRLVQPREGWGNPGKTGLTMKFVESDSSEGQWFTFEHSKDYQGVQNQFLMAVNTHHPDAIVHVLNTNPFHIDALLQLSEICSMGEDVQMAMELVERALFALEAAFHSMFSLATANCRIEYKRQENRALFLALHRHMRFVSSRACYRTALELCKVLYNLEPDSDPLCALLHMDFYALKSEQYSWFVDVFDALDPTKNLSQLPNWLFGVALAHFCIGQGKEGSKDSETKADEYLQKALINFPGVLLPLCDKCSIEPPKEISSARFFIDGQINQSPGLRILTSLYVGRSFHLWKQAELLPWLERNCSIVLERVLNGDTVVKEAEEARKTRYLGTPRNLYRHVVISEDIPEARTALPRELVEKAVLSFDPLPPKDGIELYPSPSELFSAANVNIAQDANALQLFLRSLLPNYDPNEAPREAAEGNEGGAAGGLRTGVNSLYEALQDFLSNLRLPEDNHEAADSENSD